MTNSPIVNAGFFYLDGLRIVITSSTQITISTGATRNSSNINTVNGSILFRDGVVDLAILGIGGLDIGTITVAPSVYYIYLIGDSTGYKITGGIASASGTSPLMPAGYDMYKLIGYVSIASTTPTVISNFYAISDNNGQTIYWGSGASQAISIFTPPPIAFTNFPIVGFVTPIACEIILSVEYSPVDPGNILEFRSPSSSSANGIVRTSGNAVLRVPTAVISGVTNICFKASDVTDSFSLFGWTFTGVY